MKVLLDQPDNDAIEQSNKLKSYIQQQISQKPITFADYMRLCLYTEGLGYYESGRAIFGEQGDFVTSPEEGNFFARAFAAHIKALQQELGELSIIELGAGSGRFAIDLSKALQESNCKPTKYYILETSKALQRRQQNLIQNELANLEIEITWIESLHEPIDIGVVIANEVLDALPVNLFSIQNEQITERYVALNENQEFIFIEQHINEKLEKIVRERFPQERIEEKEVIYKTEANLHLDAFIGQIATLVTKGVFFYIDYGYPRSEYYHAQRSMGTLICHYQHTAHDNPFTWPGLQDITASVDFTALAEAALKANLYINSYSTQAHFLMANDAFKNLDIIDLNDSREIKTLLMPGEMGERFQVMTLSKNIELEATRFTMRDLRHRL
ncbi:MAG: SAM-dependent methyltransferase [Pseudomonadota bacterium]